MPKVEIERLITCLNRGKSTTGHAHDMEEVYYFTGGHGRILVGETIKEIKAGDTVIIPHGESHRVFNDDCPKFNFSINI